MNIPLPKSGMVINYSYLWHDEKMRGREEGVKNRPCAIVIALNGATMTQMFRLCQSRIQSLL